MLSGPDILPSLEILGMDASRGGSKGGQAGAQAPPAILPLQYFIFLFSVLGN